MDGQHGHPKQPDETLQPIREWLIEYYVERGQEAQMHCLTILRGRNTDEVQGRLYAELRENFPLDVKLEVTVTKMVPIDGDTDEGLFEIDGAYQP
jgi:hypothetical protein